jgi:DNA polymerase elongation subunit (family B)
MARVYNCDSDCKFDFERNAAHLQHHIDCNIFTAISPDEIHLFPTREKFLPPALNNIIGKIVNNGQPLLFHPNTTLERDDFILNKENKFHIYMFGILPCGSKTCVILENVPVYVEIRVPKLYDTKGFLAAFNNTMRGKKCSYESHETVKRRPFHGHSITEAPYIRYTFRTIRDRKKFIDTVNEMNSAFLKDNSTSNYGFIELAEDDLSSSDYYFPKIAREYRFRTCDWNIISKYTVRNDLTNCKYTLIVNLNDLKRLTKTQKSGIPQELSTALNRDNTLVGSWDIETHRKIQNGQVPEETDTDFTIINICVAFFWQHTANSLLRVCLLPNTVKDAVRHDGITVMICCGNEDRLLQAYIDVLGKMQPDILMAYNGGNFDWPLVRIKLKRINKLVYLKRALSALKVHNNETEETVFKWSFKPAKIKINAESQHALKCVAQFPGILDIDVMPIFMKMYPAAEIRLAHSLNFFLMKNKLESKEDLPYKRMFKVYERYIAYKNAPKTCHCGDPLQSQCTYCNEIVPDIDCIPDCIGDNGADWEYKEELHPDIVGKCCCCGKRQRNYNDMSLVGYYCTIDCIRPQQLCVKRVIIMDKRELGTSSSTNLYDSIYRADGMRVRNCLGGISKKLGYAFSNGKCHKKDSDKDHYPGAWVFQPRKGLNNTHPVTGMDFESLYPNIMITYNYSPDMIVYDEERARELIALGYTLNKIGPFTYERGEKKGQVGNKILTISGYSVRHNGIMSASDTHIISKYIKKVTYVYGTEKSEKVFEYPLDNNFSVIEITEAVMGNIELNDTAHDSETAFITMLENSHTEYKRNVTYVPQYGREALPQERLGVFGVVVHKLFNKRVPIKAEFVRLTKLIERMEAAGQTTLVEIVDGKEVTYDIEDLRFNLQKAEAKQKAIKILNNTFYGESGNFRSPVYELLVAAGTTTTGQKNIKLVAEFVTSKGYGVQYGDSVTADTPVLCRLSNGKISYNYIADLASNWKQYGDKEASRVNLEAWTERGWTRINRVIRHYTDKKIYRILTGAGCIDVTSDHSLLDQNANKIAPTQCHIGTKLLHYDLPRSDIIVGSAYAHKDILNAPLSAQKLYLDNITQNDKLSLAIIYYLKTQVYGNNCITIDYNEHDGNLQFVHTNGMLPQDNAIVKIIELGNTTDYVYDLETENHHFAAGIGKMIVHNTDSLYLTCPDRYYLAANKQYEDKVAAIKDTIVLSDSAEDGAEDNDSGDTEAQTAANAAIIAAKEAYWEQLVKLTMRAMSFLKEEIADFLIRNNGTMRLKMAYEEVGFPTVMCGKKKYYMKPHVDIVNFRSSDIFIKGIDIIKQGQSKLAKKLGRQFMRESLQITNSKSLIELAHDSVRKFHEKDWPLDKFVLFAKYKPAKKNVPVQTFVRRMCEAQVKYRHDDVLRALYTPPEPGDKFAYVIVERDTDFTLSGKHIKLKKGDKMEYLSVYNASQNGPNPLRIDERYYLNSSILGILARFIVYYPDFQPPHGKFDLNDKEGYKSADQYCVKQAIKYLEQYSNKISGYDPTLVRTMGLARKRVYNTVNKAITTRIYSEYGPAADMLMFDFDSTAEDSATKQIITAIQEEAIVAENMNMYNYAKELIKMWKKLEDTVPEVTTGQLIGPNQLPIRPKKQSLYNIHTLRHVYRNNQNGLIQSILQFHKYISDDVINELYRIVPNMVKTLSKYKKSIVNVITDINTNIKSDDDLVDMELLSAEEVNNIKRIQALKVRLRAINYLKTEITVITRVIDEERHMTTGVDTPGRAIEIIQPVKLVPDYVWN